MHPHAGPPAGHPSGRRLEMERDTRFLALTDDRGHRSHLHRLFVKRPRLCSDTACSLVLEVLRTQGTGPGTEGRASERVGTEWAPVATLERNEHWLFVSIETAGVSFAIH
jgi:hypothetical protein